MSFGDQVSLTFERAAQGKSRLLFQSLGDEKPSVYEPVDRATPSSAELSEYVGEYLSEEIDPIYRVILADGKLMLTRLKYRPMALEPCVRDSYSSSLGTIRFTRDTSQHISGFVLDAARIRNFRFTRPTE